MATYTIQPGDTLTKIAAKLSGMSGGVLPSYVAALVSINAIGDPDKIYAGQVLNYPDSWRVIEGEVLQPEGPPRPRRPAPTQAGRPFRPGPGGTIQTMLKNPMVLGAIAIGLLAFFSMRNK